MSLQSDWRVLDHMLRHPVHGLFTVHVRVYGDIDARRCAGSSAPYHHEHLGTYGSVEAAKAACEQRIAELDGELATREPESATT